MPRVLGGRLGRADRSGPGRDDFRVQAGRRREVQQDHRAGRRPLPGAAGRVNHHRPAAGQVHRRHPGAQSHPRTDLPARAARVGHLPQVAKQAHPRAGQDDPRRDALRRSGGDAAPAHRRVHGHRQVGRPQRDADQHPLPRHSRRRAADHDRPEAARAGDVRRHPAPAHARRGRAQAGRQRAAVGGARDGGALQDAGRRRRAQHRPIQPQHPPPARGARLVGAQGRRGHPRGSCRSSSSSSTSWPT